MLFDTLGSLYSLDSIYYITQPKKLKEILFTHCEFPKNEGKNFILAFMIQIQSVQFSYYLNSKVISHPKYCAMIRQKSLCVIKETIKEKTNISRNPSLKQFNLQTYQKKTIQEEPHSKREPTQKFKKDKKGLSISKQKGKQKPQIKQQKPNNSRNPSPYLKQSLKQGQKISTNNMQMKKELKLLVSKNIAGNTKKPTEQQTQFLRKIQTFRQNRKKSEKSLKLKENPIASQRSNINPKEIKLSNQKITKESRSKLITNSTQKKSQNPQPQSLNASKHIQINHNDYKYHFGGIKNTRFSLDVNPIGVQKSQIEQALLIKPKKEQAKEKKKEQSTNFLQIFKKYKKSFDIQSIKCEKSLKNHQIQYANNNQSKNASSLSLFTTKTNKNNSQNLNNQKNGTISFERQRSELLQRALINELKEVKVDHEPKQPLQQSLSQITYVKPKFCNKLIKMIDINVPQRPTSYFAQEQRKVETPEQKTSQNPLNADLIQEASNNQFKIQTPEQSEKIIQFELYQEQHQIKANEKKNISNQQAKNKENMASPQVVYQQAEGQNLEKKFEGSKFYVQPIPTFRQKVCQNILEFESPIMNKNFEDSLIDCQIALIEKNIALDCEQLEF